MAKTRHPSIAPEGLPIILFIVIIMAAALHWVGWLAALVILPLLIAAIALFRDPARSVPVEPAAVLAPCDGRILSIAKTHESVLEREALLIRIKVDPSGAYTVRSPVEGLTLDPRDNAAAGSRLSGVSGLWVRTDAEDDVVTLFRGRAFFGIPRAFIRYGERIGQGQRLAYLRLAREAQVYMPADLKVRVAVGDRVKAGSTTLGLLNYE